MLQPQRKHREIAGADQVSEALSQRDRRIQIRVCRAGLSGAAWLPQFVVELLDHMPEFGVRSQWLLIGRHHVSVLARTTLRWHAERLAEPHHKTEDSRALAGIATLRDFLPRHDTIPTADILG